MRILFVASLHHPQGSARRSDFSEPADIPSSQAQHFWVKALTKMGHTCAVFWRSASAWPWAMARPLRMTQRLTMGRIWQALGTALPSINPDLRLRNRRLLECARIFRPHVIVLIGGNDVITPGTLEAAKREHRSVLVYACGTSPSIFSQSIERSAAGLFDLVIANDRFHAIEWRELGSPNVEVLPLSAADPEFHRPYARSESERPLYDCGVGFVGTLVPNQLYSKRIAALEVLREFELAIWSIHEVPPSLRGAYRGPALGEEMMKAISASQIVINPNGDFMHFGGNLRLFEAAGAGSFQIADDCPGVHEWFTVGTHLATYSDPDQLPQLVAHYLSHDEERRHMAAAGQQHVYAHHTYDQRMARLLELVQKVQARQARDG